MTETRPYLSRFSIWGLFGHGNYTLQFDRADETGPADINVLYGENGSGKTTILHFIYGVLTTEQRGFKTWIAKLPFKEAWLEFSDGRSLFLNKSDDDKSFLIFHTHNGIKETFRILTDSKGSVKNDIRGSDVLSYTAFLKSLNFELFYMTDKREYFTTSKLIQRNKRETDPKNTLLYNWNFVFDRDAEVEKPIDIGEMSNVISDVFQAQVLQSGISAQQSTNAIYLQLINALQAKDSQLRSDVSREQLLRDLGSLRQDMIDGEQLGVMPHIDFSKFSSAIENSDDSNLGRVSLVLDLFIKGQNARIASAQTLVGRMKSFIDELNKFYKNKTFHFDMKRKFYIVSNLTGDEIKFEWLSSGERQLFNILSSVFLTQDSAGLVLIDEPELSLNVLWQREFASSLKRISQYSPMQYILASHSLEILSNPAVNVVSLSE